ncbi:unnamed protein product [Cylicocyclus nassatus]|uniref:Uncharacterized protein n=1 Tax=Cylicocyclus nassatus TaxID=53992 RepID=A0AA36ME72_CYLNA|nr:unnamed protein product [Cylicocyclus nassatus]
MPNMFLFFFFIPVAAAQINLGQFSLNPSPEGGFNLGLSQGGNILGFGGHRALGVSGNPAGVGVSGTDNVIIANERIGVDSGLGVRQGRGIDLGSMLQFGNNPSPMQPGGPLGGLLANVKNFFDSLIPQPVFQPPMPPPRRRPRPRPATRPRRPPPPPPEEDYWEGPENAVPRGPPGIPQPGQGSWPRSAAPLPEHPIWQIPSQGQSQGMTSPQGPTPISRNQRISTEGGVGPGKSDHPSHLILAQKTDGFLPRPWETEESSGPVDGSATPMRPTTSPNSEFPTLLPERSATPPLIPEAIEAPDALETKDRPRQLPGMVEMSHHPS